MHKHYEKLNCWEFKKCGREIDGTKCLELGICPAARERAADGIHEGENGGRCCWAIAGTYCGGKVQGIYAQKLKRCRECDFFILVNKEEEEIIPPERVIDRIHENGKNGNGSH